MASVAPRKNRSGTIVWRVQYRLDGRVTQDSFTSARAARDYGALVDRVGAAAAREVLLARDRDVAVTPTLAEWAAVYLDPTSGRLGGVTEGTRDTYRKTADRSFLPIFGARSRRTR